MTESLDDIIQEFIDFVNQQVGVYMDALAGFAGHHTLVERQVHRVSRAIKSSRDASGVTVVVRASYEDPSKPDIIHNRIIRAEDYLSANAKGGSNEQQHSKAILIFLFTFWEDEIRPRLAASRGVDLNAVRSDMMGDLRVLRNVILHAKGVMRPDKHSELRKIGDLFTRDGPLKLSYESMHRVFILIKQECARLMYEWLGVKDPQARPDEIVDIAIQKPKRRTKK